MEKYRSFDLLKRLSFVRTGGSKEELAAAQLLQQECQHLGVQATIEDFEVDGYREQQAILTFQQPEMTIECAVVGNSGQTDENGLEADFCYISSEADVEVSDVAGKICLVHSKIARINLYKKLCQKKAAGLILCTGSVYDPKEMVDLDPYMYREHHLKHGKLPAVCIRMTDAEKVLRAMPKKAKMIVAQIEEKRQSHNVVATIIGSKKPQEIIAFTAHYDSVSYSQGAYDNATGSTCIMQLLAYFKEHQPERTCQFIWCGSEENGLLGSKAFVQSHKEQLEQYLLCVNVDMVGVTIGYDIACATSGMDLVNYIDYAGKMNGFAIMPRQGVYSSDSTPFADSGIPAVSFARLAPEGGARIHSRRDVLDFISENNYERTCDFIAQTIEKLVNSIAFPVKREIPDNMKEELDYYNLRKERKQ